MRTWGIDVRRYASSCAAGQYPQLRFWIPRIPWRAGIENIYRVYISLLSFLPDWQSKYARLVTHRVHGKTFPFAPYLRYYRPEYPGRDEQDCNINHYHNCVIPISLLVTRRWLVSMQHDGHRHSCGENGIRLYPWVFLCSFRLSNSNTHQDYLSLLSSRNVLVKFVSYLTSRNGAAPGDSGFLPQRTAPRATRETCLNKNSLFSSLW